MKKILIVLILLTFLVASFFAGQWWMQRKLQPQILKLAGDLQRAETIIKSRQGVVPTEREEKDLQRIVDSLLPEFNNIPPLKVVIRGKDYNWPDPNALGAFIPADNPNSQATLIIHSDAIQYMPLPQIIYYLKHELIHAWLNYLGIDDESSINNGHPRVFIEKYLALGLEGFNVTDQVSPEYFQKTVQDIKQNGYKFLPIIDKALKEGKSLDPYREQMSKE
jgi:hypothetical protein